MVKMVGFGVEVNGGADCDGGGGGDGGALGMPGEMDKLEVVEVEAVEDAEKTPGTRVQWKESSSTQAWVSWKNSPAHYIKSISDYRSLTILGRNINYPIHLIFPHDPLASRPISRPFKKNVSL